MSNTQISSIEIKFLPDFSRLTPDHPALLGVGLLCIDVDNLLTPYKKGKIYPGYVEQFSDLQAEGINTCLVTNATDGERIERIAQSLTTPYFHKGMYKDHFDKDSGMPSKTHPEIDRAAVRNVGFGSHGQRAGMVDDQLKNLNGAKQVPEFSTYFWTFPNGIRMHPGTAAGRIVEVPYGFGRIAIQNLGKLANGTHEEF